MGPWPSSSLTWLITGVTSGFGLALTRLALSHGHHVIATSRDPSKTPDLVDEVQKAGGQWLKLDLDDPNCGSVIDRLENEGTSIDVLVNSAGYCLIGPAECLTDDEAHRQLETVYFGPYRLIRAVLPRMRVRRGGMILNLSSGAGINGRDGMGIYSSGKAAADALMRVLAREVTQYNIRTLNVLLGAFDTSFVEKGVYIDRPLPEDYVGTKAEKFLAAGASGIFYPDGDHIKATQVMYEMVMGEGVGAGKESETVMVLGRDMWSSITEVATTLEHMMTSFKDICNDVHIDGKTY